MRMVLDIGDRYADITGGVSDEFAEKLRTAAETPGVTELVLDMSGTRIISSMALGTLFHTFQRLKESNKTLRVTNASPKVAHLFRLVNMTELINE